MMYTSSQKVAFFDSISQQWDHKLDLPAVRKNLVKELKRFNIKPDEHVLDVGCGTGNLTQALLDILGPSGQVTAVEFSMRMMNIAQEKIHDPRVRWQIGDIVRPMPLHGASIDRVFFYQVWPHIDQPEAAIRECLQLLKPGGQLHIWHTDSREAINHMHGHIAHQEIVKDVLLPAEEVAKMLEKAGMKVTEASESDKHYLVSASKA